MVHPRGKKGQGLVEYALIIALVVLVLIVALALFGEGIANLYENVVSAF